MKMNTVVLVVVLAILVVFAVFNFDALIVTQDVVYWWGRAAPVPVGILLLLLAAVIAVLFYLLNSYGDLRSRASEARTLRELETLRTTLDKHESSRFAQLQTYLEERFKSLEATGHAELTAQLDRLRDELAADLGQIDDYLHRRLGDTSDGQGLTTPTQPPRKL